MEQVRINADLFEAMGADGAKQVAEIMRQSGLVKGAVEIVGDASVPVPEMGEQIFGMSFSDAVVDAMQDDEMGPEFRIRLPRIRVRIPSGICRAGCDAAAAAASAKAAALTGPAAVAALAAIAAARRECRRRC